MKNVTLSVPEDLLSRARNYARERGTTLNEMIRTLLRQTLSTEASSFSENLKALQSDLMVDTTKKFDREELYER